jgi:hypothetical protein
MKKDFFKIDDLWLSNPILERLTLLYKNGYSNDDVVALTGLTKKDLKYIAKRKYLPVGKERERICEKLDILIARLNIPTVKINTKEYVSIDLNRTGHLFITRAAYEDMICCDIGQKIYRVREPDATLHVRDDNKVLIIIRGFINPNETYSRE